MKQTLDLFANDPAMRMRDSKGRFATPERAYADKAIAENKMLRLQVEKFKRAWIAAGEMSARYHRELVCLRAKLQDVLQKEKGKGTNNADKTRKSRTLSQELEADTAANT